MTQPVYMCCPLCLGTGVVRNDLLLPSAISKNKNTTNDDAKVFEVPWGLGCVNEMIAANIEQEIEQEEGDDNDQLPQ